MLLQQCCKITAIEAISIKARGTAKNIVKALPTVLSASINIALMVFVRHCTIVVYSTAKISCHVHH